MRNPYGNIAAPPKGYIWDAAKRAKVTVRSYGEFVNRSDDEDEDPGEGPVRASVPGLEGAFHPTYPPWNLSVPDNKRVDIWLEEFQKFEKEGGLPQLSIIYLPNDHTSGTSPGYPTPRAMVAENDVALGRVVEAISKSRFWKESAIFVIEDDAQDGPDHVDAHRSVLLSISPYSRRQALDSTIYTTSGVLRTMELILGIEPMSQYDAAATPLYSAFQKEPILEAYTHLPARISIEEKNASSAYGAKESIAMDFREPDRIPMRQMNEILWKAIRGADSTMPPPVRAAFIHPIPDDEEED
jgi:Phosphoesterase family